MTCLQMAMLVVLAVVVVVVSTVHSMDVPAEPTNHPMQSSTEDPFGIAPEVSTPTYAPVTLSSLASFARRFWATMASMASSATTDAPFTRTKDKSDEGDNDDDGDDDDGNVTLIAPGSESAELSVRGSSRWPTTGRPPIGNRDLNEPSSRWDAGQYRYRQTPSPGNRETTSREYSRPGRKSPENRETNFRLAKLHQEPQSKDLETTDHGLEDLSTPCNDTSSSSSSSSSGYKDRRTETLTPATRYSTWPLPPPKLLATPADEDLGDLFTSEPNSHFNSDVDFEQVAAGLAMPLATGESALDDGVQRVQSTSGHDDDDVHFLPTSNFVPLASRTMTMTTTTTLKRTSTTESPPTPDTEVSLVEIFDQDIINNKTLLASSMLKLSSVLTASLLTEESAAINVDSNSAGSPTTTNDPMVKKTITSKPMPASRDNMTSEFDFSDLFTTHNSTLSSTMKSMSTKTEAETTVRPVVTSTGHATAQLVDDGSGGGGDDDFMLNHEIVLLTDATDDYTEPPQRSNERLASLMSTGLVQSFTVEDLDSGGSVDDIGSDADAVDSDPDPDSEFIDAGMVQGSRDVQFGIKTINRFSARIRSPVKNTTEEPGECLFNLTDQNKLCDWTVDSQSSVHWLFGLGETAFMSGGPTLDSNGQTDGGYAFMDTSSGLQGPSNEIQRGSLESPPMKKTAPEGRCFTFWYNVVGLSADRLRVLLIPEEQLHTASQIASRMPSFTVLWERKDTTNGTWSKGEILYTFSKEHRVVFEGFARSGNDPRRKFQGFLAVDDLIIDSDSCKGFCTFEGVLCEWENEAENDDFDWELARGSDSHLTGPVRDHGDGPEGGFMFIDTAFPRRPGDVARILSPELPSNENGPVCFRFWTHMYGNGIGTLRVVLMDSGDADVKKIIWEVSGESGNSWHMAQVTVASSSTFRLSLEGVVGRNALGRIAIDDLSFGPGPCPSSPQTALPLRGDCTFESDECGWVNAGSGDQYDWLRTSSGQALLPGQGPNTGYRPQEPLSDHTTGLSSGFFLTMERSTIPPRGGDQAYVVGPTLDATQSGANRCFSFYGYMHERSVDAAGPGLGSLRVYLRVGSSSILRPIWRLINYEHPDWFFAQAPINTDDKFQVVIGGTWGSTRQGAIAVDDFTFFEGNCSVIPAEAKVISGECNFDSNMCEWSSGANRSRELSTWQLATSVRRPSNLDDHTYRASAGYVFFDIFSQQPHVVRLESPEIIAQNLTDDNDDDDNNNLDASDDNAPLETEHCLTFWFASFGSSRNTFLRILQKDVASNNETQLWEVTTANFQAFRPEWIYGQVAVNVTYSHRIVFEGSSNNGGFALDDIVFVPRTCQSRPENLA